MKIQLNRKLIKGIFQSSSNLITDSGMMILSLCNGQGGTPADNPQRKWDDSWQITEMAAYGDFGLISVHEFDFKNFVSYVCTGYRSMDTHFNLKGALVHVFQKKMGYNKVFSDKEISQRLSLVPLFDSSDILVPFYYSELYFKSPLKNCNSAVEFFKQLLIRNFGKDRTIICNDISITLTGDYGAFCSVNNKIMRLRFSALQVFPEVVKKHKKKKNILFPGMFFNHCLKQDFDKTPPITFQFVSCGEKLSNSFAAFLYDLMALFSKKDLDIKRKVIFPGKESKAKGIDLFIPIENCSCIIEWSCLSNILAHELHVVDGVKNVLEVLIIYIDDIAEVFFNTRSWKELWSLENRIFLNLESEPPVPVLQHGLLFPQSYKFDITLRYNRGGNLNEDDVYEAVRISAVDIIKEVQMINQYDSEEGWSSKCFRITYQSLNEPLNKKKVVCIHNNLIGKLLMKILPVEIK